MKNTKTKIGLALLLVYALSFTFTSCEEQQNEDIVKAPNTDGSIETILKVNHHEKFDVLTAQYTVWVKGKVSKIITTNDTLPSLGSTTQVGENDNGDTKSVTLPKNYELYITVK